MNSESARARCEISFFSCSGIAPKGVVLPSGTKIESQPKPPLPCGDTIVPFVRPTKSCGSLPGPAEKASTHWQYALLSL